MHCSKFLQFCQALPNPRLKAQVCGNDAIKKFNGHLALLSGKLIECQGEIDENLAPTDAEFLEKTKQDARDIVEKFQIPRPIVVSLDGSYVPTGPVVDSTLAEKDEESQ